MIGDLGLYIAFATAIIAVIGYTLSSRGNQTVLKVSRFSFYVHLVAVKVSSIYLLYSILEHKFQYSYVYAYSERSLDLKYLISAFWAGQDGANLLWALIAAVIGVIIINKDRKFEPIVMAVISAGQLFLLLFLIIKSPFILMSHVPVDGVGLNPLLLNLWMVIHPPVVFIGYAIFIVPFAYAIAALWRRDYHSWVSKALPWALVGWFFLGAGIFIGGYWAYRVLGWGGYWGWDPVENASLVPWLTGGAMIHGYLLQKSRRILARTNIFLSLITFVLILYASFLTGSGVLEDFSVHSFAATPLAGYLLLFMLVFLGAGLLLFFVRYQEIPQGKSEGFLTRGSLFIYGVIVLVTSAALIILGTSSPILTGLMGSPSSVGLSYYELTNVPVAIAISLLLAFIPFLSWNREDYKKIIGRILPLAVGVASGAVVFLFFGIPPVSLIIIATAVFALLTSILSLYESIKKKGLIYSGGHLAHAGVALMLIGIIGTMGFSQNDIVSLPEGASEKAKGYALTFREKVHDEQNEQDVFLVDIYDGKNYFLAEPRMYLAGREPQLIREPSIKHYWWGDLYLSPLELQTERPGFVVDLVPGETRLVSGMEVTFVDFIMPEHGDGLHEGFKIKATLEVKFGQEEDTLSPMLLWEESGWSSEPVSTPNGGTALLERIDPGTGKAFVRFISPFNGIGTGREVLVVDVSRKPLIPMLTLGTILIMIGTLIASWRRFIKRSG